MFDIFKKKIGGEIGYFGLADWWISSFSEEERKYIQGKYSPLGLSSSSLVSGNISSTSQTVVGFLSGLSSWFSKENERPLAYKIIEKAESLIDEKTKPLDIHFLYQAKIEISYKDREKENGLEKAIKACNQQISIANKAASAFKREYKGGLPSHKGYEQLAIILEKQKKYEEAIEVSNNALRQGWSGSWEKRIERCSKKLEKA